MDNVELMLQLLQIFTSWPIILLLIVLIFRRQIGAIIPELSHRLQKATIAGSTFEFSKIAFSAFQDALEEGAEELKGKPDEFVEFVRQLSRKLPETGTTLPRTEVSLTGQLILWVDDQPMNNLYESSVLRRLGASITFARTTQEALAFVSHAGFDLIISDVHRVEDGHGNLNAGYELLEKLTHQTRPYPGTLIPFVFYTSSVHRINPLRARSARGAADSADELIMLVVNVLSH